MASKKQQRAAQAAQSTDSGTNMSNENQQNEVIETPTGAPTETPNVSGEQQDTVTGAGSDDTSEKSAEEESNQNDQSTEETAKETAAPINNQEGVNDTTVETVTGTPAVEEDPEVDVAVEDEAPTEYVSPNDAIAASYGLTNINAVLALQTIDEYIVSMGPNIPMSDEDGARKQVSLYRAIVSIINNSGDDFDKAFATLLAMFHAHSKGVFQDVEVFRFFETMMLSRQDRDIFQRLLNLFMLTADPKGRALGAKQFNFEATLGASITDEGRQRVANFFQM